ncbi:MAG: hypothetical protein MUE78_09465 [Ilumatobacteraceae bacterium]|jgi:hypothetical protein|nr:hypothetical protein [Ilumatobacteraceae bacterium]
MSPSRLRRIVALVVALASSALGACSDDGAAGDGERFCGEIQADPAAIVDPALATDADLDALLERYRELADLAPQAISEEWDAIVLNVETASTVVVDDPESVQRAVAQAYATEVAAVEVQRWLRVNCGVDIGPVATITPQGPVSPPTPPSTGSVPAAGG